MEGGEPSASGGSTQKPDPKPCGWSNCKRDHGAKLEYPDDGNVTREDGLRAELFVHGREPWDAGGFGEGNKPIYLVNGKVKKNADGSNFFAYRIQAHHLIPIKQMGKTSTLKANAKLAGYDIDDMINGMFLPQDWMDMAIHRLQQHNTSHGPKYTAPISRELREIEQAYEKMCQGTKDISSQMMIVQELNALSLFAEQKILAIRHGGACWPLNKNTQSRYRSALLEYQRRKALNAKLPKGTP
jgi:hypothetical protein